MNKELLKSLPKTNVSEIIIQRITDALISGELKPGDKIPTEIGLSEALGVGRNAVREALKVLIAFGVLEIHRSEGTFIATQFNQNLLNPILYSLILENKSMEDLLEFKITFLNSILYLAVQKVTNEDIDKLYSLNNRFRKLLIEEQLDINKIYAASYEFNYFLGEISKNPLFIQMNKIVLQISKFSRIKAIRTSINNNCKNCLPDIYDEIINLIERRDMAGIPKQINSVLICWKKLLLPI